MPRRNWSREETLVAFNLYCHTSFGKLWHGNPEIIAVAQAIGRTPGSVAMKCCNLAAFDAAHQARGVSGLRNAARLDREIWEEFQAEPERVAYEAELAYAAALRTEPRKTEEVEWEDVVGLDREAVVKVRVNQQFFRALIMTGYRSQCAVCELPVPALLVASHIIPWSVDPTLRMNPQNGICLCTLHDRAFDRGLVTIRDNFTIAVSSFFDTLSHLRPVADSFLRFRDAPLHLPERWYPDPALLRRHAELTGPRAL
jgi:putative restriction endonuclease